MSTKRRKLSSKVKSFLGLSSSSRNAGESGPLDSTSAISDGRAPETLSAITQDPKRIPGSSGRISPPSIYSPAGTESLSFFSGANNFHLEQFSVIHTSPPPYSLDLASSEGWKLLLQHTAPNALHDSSARFDPPKCDEDTRVGILEEIMARIGDRTFSTQLLCLTGAAGAGKSALQQSIAERCSLLKILASSFFFSASDPTRNNVLKLVPTMAYQIAEKDMRFRRLLIGAIESEPLIFEKSLRKQFNTLIMDPWRALRAGGDHLQSFPHAVLIDGVDECLDMRRQEELLVAVKDVFLSSPDHPFRVFLSSRPELPIRTALDPSGVLHNVAYHIRLSDDHDATEDIRLMLGRRLKDIGRRSNDTRAHIDQWPTEEDVETLVEAASGQFIYAATVVKYVGDVRSSPVERLRAILTWTPGKRGRPFAPLDLLYSSIVSTAKTAYEASDTNEYDFLLLLKVFDGDCKEYFNTMSGFEVKTTEEILNLPDGTFRLLISDLRSLIRVVHPSRPYAFHYYHRSFSEWLRDETRSGPLFVPPGVADEFMVPRVLQSVLQHRQAPGNSLQAGQAVAFLVCMGWMREDPTSPVINHFIDLISDDTTILDWIADSLVDYCDLYAPGGERSHPSLWSALPALLCGYSLRLFRNSIDSLAERKAIARGVEGSLCKAFEVAVRKRYDYEATGPIPVNVDPAENSELYYMRHKVEEIRARKRGETSTGMNES